MIPCKVNTILRQRQLQRQREKNAGYQRLEGKNEWCYLNDKIYKSSSENIFEKETKRVKAIEQEMGN